MSTPRLAFIRLLEACNAGCFMCDFAWSQAPLRISEEEALTLARRLGESTIRAVRFTGGEPLLVPWLPELVAACHAQGLLVSTLTNGWHLAERAPALAAAGLSQVVLSIDGTHANTHDRFRRTPGLFDRLLAGLRWVRSEAPAVRLRVNTVAGPHNIGELPELWELLSREGVEQWSIIPLKRAGGAWQSASVDRLRGSMKTLQRLAATGHGPRLMGFSDRWAGRDEAELQELTRGERSFTPRGGCQLVDAVRYLVPAEDRCFPCNCVPHRTEGQALGGPLDDRSLGPDGLVASRTWLRTHGPAACTGCEPLNAALGEGLIDLDADPLGF